MALIEFENDSKYFVKFFLLDASLNLNRWGVTQQSLERNLETFVGKPFVLTPEFNHPTAMDGDDLLVQQERYRVGNIIMVGIEERSGTAYGVAEITNSSAKEALKNGEVNFVSPSIVFNHSDEVDIHGNAVIEDFEGAHVAGVKEPAYTISKAQIKGKCAGSEKVCLSHLQKVEASRSSCGKFTKVKAEGTKIIGSASKCVEECVDKKLAKGDGIDEQDLAICYSECDSAQAQQDQKEEAFLSMMYKLWNNLQKKPHKANIDQESLDNITQINLPKKKKKEAEGDEVTTKNKIKIIMPKKAQHISLKGKKSRKANNMKTLYAEEEDKKKANDTDKEDEVEKAEDLSNPEEKRFDDEMNKAKKAEEKDEDKEDAEDTDKLDLTDKQKEFLRDSKLASQIKVLKAEVKALKSHIRKAKVEPIIESILDAKSKLGKIDAQAEYNKLIKLDSETLQSLKADYQKLSEANVSPRFEVKYASVEKAEGDAILKRIREGYD
jgi:hypothetical protein